MSELKQKLQTQLMDLLNSPDYEPLRRSEIAALFKLDSAERRTLRYVIRTLEAENKILILRRNRVALPEHGNVIDGKLSLHQKGFGFVSVDPGFEVDGEVYMPAEGLQDARHGDRVKVCIFESAARPGKMPSFASADGKVFEGRVLEVLERGFTEVVGLLTRKSKGWILIPDNARLEDIAISGFADSVSPTKKHKVVVQIDDAPFPGAPLTGVVIEDLGAFDEPGVDMLAVMRMYELDQHFSPEVLAQAEGYTQATIDEISKEREDLRDWVSFTIDPVDAKDFDDALSLRKLDNGNWQIGVHIADVSGFIEMDSPIDIEAQRRATSAYLVDRVVTMLPENLTNGLCSLRPRVDRLAHSVLIEVDLEGRLAGFDTCKSIIHSKARLNYGQAQAFIDEGEAEGIPQEVQDALRELFPLTDQLRALRFEAGSMLFESSEVKCILDEDGKVARVERRSTTRANHLVEECMLLANKVVATILTRDEATAGIYRIHEPPSEKQWGNMAEDLRLLGIHDPPQSREDINAILGGGLPEHLVVPVTVSILRNLNRAVYSAKLDEHFGLAFEEYSHFTSPIRRYPDLMAHRMLEAIEKGLPPPYTFDQVRSIALHCSEREQMAEEAEKLSVQIKLMAYYADMLWKGEVGPLEGVITGMVSRGLIVELTDTMQRGMVGFQDIEGDYYELNASSTVAKGSRSGRTFRLGDRIMVLLSKVDTRNRRIDFALDEQVATHRYSKGGGGKAKRKDKGKGGKRHSRGKGGGKGHRKGGRKK